MTVLSNSLIQSDYPSVLNSIINSKTVKTDTLTRSVKLFTSLVNEFDSGKKIPHASSQLFSAPIRQKSVS